ncbi:hypothetical protein HDU91_005600 [Kappamyces sp. JEL0680]|nr:hypothetical protein HDU91_005600 [Kappamyces sp. JEL0680]
MSLSIFNRPLIPNSRVARLGALPATLFNDPFFRDPFSDLSLFQPEGFATVPQFDVVETTDKFLIKGNLAGWNKDQIEVSLEGSLLSIKGHWEKTTEEKDSSSRYLNKERAESSFTRSFNLGSKAVVSNEIKAKLSDGVLSLMIPKDVEKSESVKIPIE